VLQHDGGVASAVTVSSTVTAMAGGVEAFVHGDAGRLVLLPDRSGLPLDAYAAAVSDLTAAAVTGGSHPCDAAFARDVTVVLATAQRALASGCREDVVRSRD
jgi:hypothetical protein